MAENFKMPNRKRKAITAIIVTVLAIAAIAGTVAFVKSRGTAQAAGTNEAGAPSAVSGDIPSQNGNDNPQGGEGTDNPAIPGGETENPNGENAQGNNEEPATNNNEGTNETGRRSGRSNTRREEELEEVEIIDYVTTEAERGTDGRYLSWAIMGVNADLAFASKVNTTSNPDGIVVKKEAKTSTGKNLATAGEEITYTITVTADKAVNAGVEVTDRIPENTTYVDGSADNNGVLLDKNGKETTRDVAAIRWEIDVTEQNKETGKYEAKVSFKVRVNEKTTGTIENIAIANGETSEPAKTAVVTTSKTRTIYRDAKEVEAPAMLGDEIEYTITVKNTSSDVEGTTTIKDADLKTILNSGVGEVVGNVKVYKNDELVSGDKTADELISGINGITVPANGEAKVVFTIKLIKIDGKVRNTALVSDEETDNPENNPEAEDVDTVNIVVDKEVTSKPANQETGKYALGETVSYKLTVTNTGSIAAEGVKVSDKINGVTDIEKAITDGEEVTLSRYEFTLEPNETRVFTYDYVVTEADILAGKISNDVLVTGTNTNTDTDEEEVDPEDPVSKIDVEKEVTSKPINQETKKYTLGETVSYKVTVTNIGNQTVENITLSDKINDTTNIEKATTDEGEVTLNGYTFTLKPGESKEFTYDYVVTEADILAGKISNAVTATGTNTDTDEEEVTPEDPVRRVEVEKEVTSTIPQGQTAYKLGDTVSYKITVTNTGNQTVDGIVVTDKINGIEEITTANEIDENGRVINENVSLNAGFTLKPGESKLFAYNHVVTNEDIEAGNGKLVNNVTVKGNNTDTDTDSEEEKLDTLYTVEFYYQVNGAYGNADSSVTRQGAVGDTASVTDEDKTPTKTGYTLDTSKADSYSGAIVADGSLTLKVYFKEQFTVTYKDGVDGAVFADQVTEGIDYGTNTPAFVGTTTEPTRTGYDFTGWNPSVADTVTANATYTATWREIIYNITYDLDGGSLADGVTNPSTYKVTSPDITLNNPSKVGYDFAGWTGTDIEDKTITVTIVTGSTGDRAYTANWTPRDDTAYTVNHWKQNLDKPATPQNEENYTLAETEDNLKGTTGASVTPAVKDYTGFTAPDTQTVTIAADGSTVVNYYYTRNTYTVTYVDGVNGTAFADQVNSNVPYEATTPAFNGTPARTGYDFAGWNPEVADKVTADVTYTATWTPRNDTEYKVEYYYEENGAYPETATSTSTPRTGTTGATATVTDADKAPEEGYIFDEAAANVLSGTIAADGSLRLKVYFKQQFTVTYTDGVANEEVFADQTTGSLNYGTATPAFNGTPSRTGYDFAGWSPAVAGTVTANATYTATWRARNDTAYKVEFYYEENGTYPETATSTSNRTGTTGETVSVTDTDKAPEEGYVFDEAAQNVLSGTVLANGGLVLKLYFKAQYTVTYTDGVADEVVFADQITRNIDYGTATPAFNGTPSRTGYDFAGWSPAVAGTVTANATYTATWTPRSDTPYKVEYYYQVNGVYPETATSTSEERHGVTGATATVTDADKTPDEGYAFDSENEKNVLTGAIAADGSLRLKVYFKEQFTVTYKPGTQGAFSEQKTEGIDYGTTTPSFTGEKTGNDGFYFVRWDKEIADTVTANAEYTAIWEGLTVTKTRTEIVDVDDKENATYIDQVGDVVKYTIEINNVGDVVASNITLTDSYDVKVTSITVAGENVAVTNTSVQTAGSNLLQGINTTIDKNETIVVKVEHTVTQAELDSELAGDKLLVNTATAKFNNHEEEGEDGGTPVKQLTDYTVKYYLNNVYDDRFTIEGKTAIGNTISFDNVPQGAGDYTFIKYIGIDGEDFGSKVIIDGTNVIEVYLGKPDVDIKKTVKSSTVKAGGNIEYLITLTNKGYVDSEPVTVVDKLEGITYVNGSASLDPTSTDNSTLKWNVTSVPAATSSGDGKVEITFKAKVPKNFIGHTISNTAKIEGTTKSSTITKKADEVHVTYEEWIEGKDGTDLNIIFVVDNSSSMNYRISGSYSYNNWPIAPTDAANTRLAHAKTALEGFIQNKAATTDIRVITFNTKNTGTASNMRTLVDPADIKTKQVEKWIQGHYEWQGFSRVWVEGHYETVEVKYTTINGTDYEIDEDERAYGSDGERYYYVYVPIEHGAISVGTSADSNLVNKVRNISISSELSGFGTYVKPAFKLINDNKSTYLSTTKKNIVIVLADGAFDDSYGDELSILKDNVADVYCIGFGEGREFNETALKNMSTNNTCYTATNSTNLLSVFDAIEAEANGDPHNGDTNVGTIELDEASKVIKVSSTCPVTIKDTDRNVDLVTCTTESALSQYGISLSADKKTLTWDANEFMTRNPNYDVPSSVKLVYYVGRNDS